MLKKIKQYFCKHNWSMAYTQDSFHYLKCNKCNKCKTGYSPFGIKLNKEQLKNKQ